MTAPLTESAACTQTVEVCSQIAAEIALQRATGKRTLPAKLAAELDSHLSEALFHVLKATVHAGDAAIRRCGTGAVDPEIVEAVEEEAPEHREHGRAVSSTWTPGDRVAYRRDGLERTGTIRVLKHGDGNHGIQEDNGPFTWSVPTSELRPVPAPMVTTLDR